MLTESASRETWREDDSELDDWKETVRLGRPEERGARAGELDEKRSSVKSEVGENVISGRAAGEKEGREEAPRERGA